MAAESTKITALLLVAGFGVGLVALPWLPARQPNPLPAEFALESQAGKQLLSALQWHDEACATGDLQAFGARVTERHARAFARRLQQLGRAVDAATLRDYVGKDRSAGLAQAVLRGCRGGFSTGDRACFVVEAPAGQRGVQGIACVWDGARLRLDGVVHAPEVAADDARAVAAFARRLLTGD